jgi:hypothetical protein
MNEQLPKDIPIPKDFNKDIPIEIKTLTGIIELFPINGTRGSDREKYRIKIEGVCFSPIQLSGQGYIIFKEKQFSGHFGSVLI